VQKRRTKPRVAWLPHTDTAAIINPDNNRGTNVIDFEIDVSSAVPFGGIVTAAVPVVIDDKQDPLNATTTLADIEDSGYRLRRIVGKCFVGVSQQAAQDPGLYLIAAAFIILRVSEQNGSVPLAANLDNYNLFDTRNDDSPWIWRREWILQNALRTTKVNKDYPLTNAEYGSGPDGPHIDQKTARVVMSDERLFFVASVMPLAGGDEQIDGHVGFILTTRVLASMRTTLGNRRNASR